MRVVRQHRDRRTASRGQGLVEFAALVPMFLLLLLGMLEFGFVFDQDLTLEYATREGARVGSALANGGGDLGCGGGQSPNRATVDPQILAAVQRVLLSPSSRVVPEIGLTVLIWKADANGAPVLPLTTYQNTWVYTTANDGPVVDNEQILFKQVSQPWNPCSRSNGGSGGPDSIGISITHAYSFQTPLAGIFKVIWPNRSSTGQLTMSDKTVMALNPTN